MLFFLQTNKIINHKTIGYLQKVVRMECVCVWVRVSDPHGYFIIRWQIWQRVGEAESIRLNNVLFLTAMAARSAAWGVIRKTSLSRSLTHTHRETHTLTQLVPAAAAESLSCTDSGDRSSIHGCERRYNRTLWGKRRFEVPVGYRCGCCSPGGLLRLP